MCNKISITKIYLFTAIVILVIALLLHNFTNTEIDVALHDIYFILHKIDVFLVYILIFLISAGFSFLFHKLKKPLLKSLFWVHYLCTIPGIIFVALYDDTQASTPTRYYDSPIYEEFLKAENQFDSNFWIAIIFVLIIPGLLAFLINLIVSVVSKKTNNPV